MKNCPNCGAQNADDAVFCHSCGIKLEVSEAPQPQVTNAEPVTPPVPEAPAFGTVPPEAPVPPVYSTPPVPPVPPVAPPPPYQQGSPYQQPNQQYNGYFQQRPMSTGLLVWSIINTCSILFCCCTTYFTIVSCILGIIAIVQTTGARNAINDFDAESKLKLARNLNIIATVLFGVGLIVYILLIVFGVFSSSSFSDMFGSEFSNFNNY